VTEVTEAAVGAPARARVRRLRWWREVLYVAAFYAVYTGIRNTQGSQTASVRHAFNNARHVIGWERSLHIFAEQSIQHAFLRFRHFIQFWNVYYGSAHFVVTAVALIWMFRRMPERYPLWRNTLAITTALALIGFALYPLMPPRLLDYCGPYGACRHYRFVDTLRAIGGLWNFDSGAMQKISNQYAAMPSLHCAWAGWCAFVLWPGLKRWWSRALVLVYPAITVFCIVVTANHYFLDAAGGAATLAVGYVLARVLTRYTWPGTPAPAPRSP
jgi:PAP2 superfamily